MTLLWSVSGDVLQTWHGPRIQDLTVLPSGEALVGVSERQIIAYSLMEHESAHPSINTFDKVTRRCTPLPFPPSTL
jgi:hypothetical protein